MTIITALPPAPNRADPLNFADVADTWVAALPAFGTETNAVVIEVNAFASTATIQAGIATTGADTATQKALEASNSATTALNAPGTSATSTSSLTVANSSQTLTIQTGKALVVGMTVKIAYTTTPTTWMLGDITAYNSGTGSLTVQVLSSTGSGTFSAWTVSLSAPGGVTSAGTQTLTNKTIIETVFALTGTTPAFLMTNGSVQTWTLSGTSTPTDSLTAGASIILVITPGAFTITWPSVVWTKQGGSGVAPTLFSAGKTTVVLWKINSTLYGSHLGDTV